MTRLIPGLAALLFLLPSLPAQRGPIHKRLSYRIAISAWGLFRNRFPRVSWGPAEKLLREGGQLVDPLSGKPPQVPPGSHLGRDGRSLKQQVQEAIQKASGQKVPIKSGRRYSTVPRAPEGNCGVLTAPAAHLGIAMAGKDLWVSRVGSKPRQLTHSQRPKRHVELAPDGSAVSYIQDWNLYVVNTHGGPVRQITKDGSGELFYGELDWVLQEEVWGRSKFKGTWWSPKTSRLAYLRVEEQGVPTYHVIRYVPHHPKDEPIKYPKAGDQNPRTALFVVSGERSGKGASVQVDLSRYQRQGEFFLVRVGWTPDGKELLFQVQNREQTWLDLDSADPDTGRVKVLIHEQSKSWVNVLDGIHWLKDGDFLFESERTGFKHLYRYSRNGRLKGAVTRGPWQILSIQKIDEKRGEIVFSATKDGDVNTNWYIIGLDGSGLRRLTPGEGTHTISWNHDQSLYIDSFTSVSNPGTSRLYKRDGSLVRELARGRRAKASGTFAWSQPELITIPARDGYEIDALITKPVPFDANKPHPLWVSSYFGPAAPSVSNRWQSSTWNQFLAEQGIVVLQLNVRTASRKGHKITSLAYQQLGVQELKDLEDAVDWLAAKTWVDASRVGITGYSYGGFMTAYALLNSNKFRLGVAGGGVYDWRNYDTIYTERYMRTPQHNPAGYDITSCVKTAAGLHGHLVIQHGVIDENVHMQNAMQLIRALQDAGKGAPGQSFELMLYPGNRHGYQTRGGFMYSRLLLWESMKRYLLQPDKEPALTR